MSDEQTRNNLSMEDKVSKYSYKIEHPEASFMAIRKIFSEKLEKPIEKSMVFRSYRLISTQKEQGLELIFFGYDEKQTLLSEKSPV